GSRILPSSEIWPVRRAILPSIQSLPPMTASSPHAHAYSSADATSQTNRGRTSSRETVMTFGRVRRRSASTARSMPWSAAPASSAVMSTGPAYDPGPMPTVFTKIIQGELPGRFVWRDDRCVAFLSINPMAAGHTLVVPVEEVDHWIDLDPDLLGHLVGVAREIARAQQAIWEPEKVGMMIAGLEVPHVHLHLVPISGVHDLDFSRADPSP